MYLTPKQLTFLENHHSAAMITLAKNGTPKVARVGIALVDIYEFEIGHAYGLI